MKRMQYVQHMERNTPRADAHQLLWKAHLDASPDMVVICDADGVITWASCAAREVSGYECEFLIGRALASLVHADDLPALAMGLSAGAPATLDLLRFEAPDGGWRWMEVHATKVADGSEAGAFQAHLRDVSERIEREIEEGFFARMANIAVEGWPVGEASVLIAGELCELWRATSVAVVRAGHDGVLTQVGHYGGTCPWDTIADSAGRLEDGDPRIPCFWQGPDDAPEGLPDWLRATPGAVAHIPLDPDGTWGYIVVHGVALGHTPGVERLFNYSTMTIRSLDARERLVQMTITDSLTGCANHRHFQELLRAGWKDGGPLALAVLDIDHFKRINDTHGHSVGDVVLAAVADVIRSEADGDVIARIGGEEFAWLSRRPADELHDLVEHARATVAAEKRGGVEVRISGGVCGRACAASPSALVEQADAALYMAKGTGRNRIVYFDELPRARTHATLEEEEGLPASAVAGRCSPALDASPLATSWKAALHEPRAIM